MATEYGVAPARHCQKRIPSSCWQQRAHARSKEPMLARGFSLARRFSLCRILLKGQSGRNSVGRLAMPVGADVVKFDAGLRRVYIACSSGFIFVFHAEDEIHDRKREDFAVEKIVHSLAVDSATHRV